MKVLVTGGAGFIGSHVVDQLIMQQHQVVVVDDLSTGLRENVNGAAQFYQLDIRSAQLVKIVAEHHFDCVLHLAAQTAVPVSLERPGFDCEVNVLGSVNLLEACRRAGVKRVIFSSSAAVYGQVTELPVAETAVTVPTSFYGLSKLTVEQYLRLYHDLFGLDYVLLRYANVYGERQGDAGEGGVVSIFSRRIWRDQTIAIYGDGGQTRDFVYVGDVAAANLKAMVTAAPNAVYNISTQTQTSINTLVQQLTAIAGKQVPVVFEPPRSGDIYHSMLGNTAAQSGLGWQPQVAVADGLARTYQYLGQ